MSQKPEPRYEIDRVVFRDAVRLPSHMRQTAMSWGRAEHGKTSTLVATNAGSVTITSADGALRVLVPAANVAAIEERAVDQRP
jgi:hypothetical protein